MDGKAKGGKDPGDEKKLESASKAIAQIESLQLPKRMEKRRAVYLGEQVSCWIRYDQHEIQVKVIDLSSLGIAVVEAREKVDFPCAIGQKISLEFDRGTPQHFTVAGEVSNLSQVQLGQKRFKRLGIRFVIPVLQQREDFWQVLGETVIPCRSAIRPQASCRAPLFYNELMLFQVEGFSPHGVELMVSARTKSLLPHQPLELDIYMPGRGRFVVPVSNAAAQQRASGGGYRIFTRYQQAPPPFLEAVSEYLVMFAQGVSPRFLRAKGFPLGDLSHAFEISHASLSEDVVVREKLEPSVLGLPFFSASKEHKLSQHTRTIRCKLGPQLVAVMGLTFVEGESQRSQFHQWGHAISSRVLEAGHLELSDFYISPKALLVDFLLPLLKHLVRIAIQGRAAYLLVECQEQLQPILLKMGFQDHGSRLERQDDQGRSSVQVLMELPTSLAVVNKDKFLPENVWRKVYGDLFEFFKTQKQKQRQVKR